MPHYLNLALLEYRQQLRGRLIWLIIGVGFLYANPFFNSSPSLWEALYKAVGQYSMSVLSLVFGLWGTISAMRERRQRVSILIESTRVPSHTLFIGQWLGLALTAFMLLATIHIFVSLVFIGQGASFSLSAMLRSITVICFPWAMFMVTFGFLLGSFTPIFISVPAVGVVWYATAIISLFGNLESWVPEPWATLIDPSTVFAASASVSFGFLPLERLIMNRLLYVAVTLLALGVGALFYKRHRENRLSITAFGIICISCVVVSLIVGFSQYWSTNAQTFHLIDNSYEEALDYSKTNHAEATRYEISVEISSTQRDMVVDTILYILNNGELPLESFAFNLYEKFSVESITGGKIDMEWRQDADNYYWVKLNEPLAPNEQTSIAVSYVGQVYEWHMPLLSSRPELFAFLTPAGFILPSVIDWYPILGANSVQSDIPPSNGKKGFSIKINGNIKPIVVNLPQVGLDSWEGYASELFVASANWHDIKSGSVHLWYTPEQVKNAQLLVNKLDYMYELCKKYLGEPDFETIIAVTVPQTLHRSMKMEVNSRQVGVIFLTDTRLASEIKGSDLKGFNVNYYQQELLLEVLSLWLDLETGNNLDYTENTKGWGIAGYMWSLFREQCPGLPGSMEQEREFRRLRYSGNQIDPRAYVPGLTLQRFSQEENQLWSELDTLNQERGTKAVKARLEELLSEIQ